MLQARTEQEFPSNCSLGFWGGILALGTYIGTEKSRRVSLGLAGPEDWNETPEEWRLGPTR